MRTSSVTLRAIPCVAASAAGLTSSSSLFRGPTTRVHCYGGLLSNSFVSVAHCQQQQVRFARGGSKSNSNTNNKSHTMGGGSFNPYKILGVTPETPAKDIKKAYQRLALKYHPDNAETGDGQKFQAVHEAYSEVRDGKVWKDGQGSRSSREAAENGTGTGAADGTSGMRGNGYYTYEEPGSTTENYFQNNRRLGTFVTLLLLYSFGFLVIRVLMFMIFPLTGQAPKPIDPDENPDAPPTLGEFSKNPQQHQTAPTVATPHIASSVSSMPPPPPSHFYDATTATTSNPLGTDFLKQVTMEEQERKQGGFGYVSGSMGGGNSDENSATNGNGGLLSKIWRF